MAITIVYTLGMMKIETTEPFDQWLKNLRDKQGRARILDRIKRVAAGNIGDCKSVGGGVSELRLAFGPGYRVYFIMHDKTLIVLLCGGDKSTQSRDIRKAHELAEEWRLK
jgi:putative addiction module killer protein